MHRDIVNSWSMVMLLPVLLLSGCSDDKAPVRVEESHKEERIFDTQRSALEQAKETADSATMRSQQFQERAKEND